MSELLTDEEMDDIDNETMKQARARRKSVTDADLFCMGYTTWFEAIAKAQISKLKRLGWKSPKEVAAQCSAAFDTGLSMGKKQERERIREELKQILDKASNYRQLTLTIAALIDKWSPYSIHEYGRGRGV